MPLLSRNTRKLLTNVKGNPHATQDDHVDALPTPPTGNSTWTAASEKALIETEDDVNRDPESSDDDRDENAQLAAPVIFKRPSQTYSGKSAVPALATFKKPVSSSPLSFASKRSSNSDGPISDNEDPIFSSQGSKWQRTSHSGNIHVSTTKSRFKPQLYGKAGKARPPKSDSGAIFKQARKLKAEVDDPAPVFKTARGSDMFKFGDENRAPMFKASRVSGGTSMDDVDGSASHSRSPSLSSLSSDPHSPGAEEVQMLDLPAAQPYDPKIECKICGQDVNLFLKQDFEDEFTPGKRMSYKWQQRFCRFHKQHEAKQVWQERGYPDIDWDGLERRMMKHHSHLEDVLCGKRPSCYRDELAERLKCRNKTTLQAVTSEDAKGGGHVGYYGPRGEKAMTDHIIAQLSVQLRKQAAQDKLVAAAGISGGVSGFIQAVLVPELTSQLVREDLSVSDMKARDIVAESTELGDLLNPEIEEKVDKVIDHDE